MKRPAALLLLTAILLCTACSGSASGTSDDTVSPAPESSAAVLPEVYLWQDYFETDEFPFGEDFELKYELAEFPDTVFIWKDYTIYSYENGEERSIVSGMPLWNAFFTDLNADGYPELCTTASWGSGIVSDSVFVFDYHNDKAYGLSDRMNYDYSLYLKNGKLYVRQLPYNRDENTKANVGKLAIKNDELVMR